MKISLAGLRLFQVATALVLPLRLVIFGLCATWVAWFCVQFVAPEPTLTPAMPTGVSEKYQMDQRAEARLLGVETEGGMTPPSVTLQGLFANAAGQGAAVMSIDGLPPISVQVGDEVTNGWVLTELGANHAVLQRNGQRHQVDLPSVPVDAGAFQRISPP